MWDGWERRRRRRTKDLLNFGEFPKFHQEEKADGGRLGK